MNISELAATRAGQRGPRIGADPIALFAVTLAAMLGLLWLAQHVIDAGFVRRDIVALESGDAWKRGGWLSQLLLAVVGLVPHRVLQQSVLSLTGAGVVGACLGIFYRGVRVAGWGAIGGLVLVAAIGGHALMLYSVTAGSRMIPLLIVLAALIPAIRTLERVGDVQASISLGMTLPLLLLASPATTPLVLPLALAATLSDRDGRSDPRAFFAMMLVALLPTLIVAVGAVGFAAQAGDSVADALLPYVAAFRLNPNGNWVAMLSALIMFAPVLLVPLLYCVLPTEGEPRHVWSALAVVILPLYLALGGAVFEWNMPVWGPPVALLATLASWLAGARLTPGFKLAALVLLVVSAGLSWMANPYWADAGWRAAILGALPHWH